MAAGTVPLLAVCGPTASGKTGLAIALAKRLDGEIVSADSMQIYRRMDIGTAKPTPSERAEVPHHLIDILEPGASFSVAQYTQRAKAAIAEVTARGKLPVLAGGTGLYIDSLTRNIQFAEMKDNPARRQELTALAEARGNACLLEILQGCDPVLAAGLHPNDRGRIIRAIEVFEATGVPQSEWQRRSRLAPSPYRLCMLGLDWPRETLYRRIDERVDDMMAQGLLKEAQALYDRGLSATAAQAIGYKELFAAFAGERSVDEAVEDIKRESRRYAKRQLTWLRRDERIHWLQADAYETSEALAEAACRLAANTLGRGL